MKRQNLVLVGFKGAGKSTYGREMARLAGLPFADLDAEVEFLIGRSIYDFVDEYGWQVFREFEQRVTHDFSRHFSGVIATGGGTIENSKNLQNLKKTGAFAFLNPDYMEVRDYLIKTQDDDQRPRINPEIPLWQELDQLWNQRKGIYGAASDIEVVPEFEGDITEESTKMLQSLPADFVPTRPPEKKVVIMSSSKGTTMGGLFERQLRGRIPNVTFSAFITDKPDCGAAAKAKELGIKRIEVIEPQADQSREEYDRNLLNLLREEQPDIIILAGWMRILSPLYCDQFGHITLNVHPSLLPEYKGMMGNDIHESVLSNSDKYTGCTIHRVTSAVDEGETVVQRKVVVQGDDTVEKLKARVQQQEILGFCEILEKR